jgi:hypothetical protein
MFNQLAKNGARTFYNVVLPTNLFQPQDRAVHEVNGLFRRYDALRMQAAQYAPGHREASNCQVLLMRRHLILPSELIQTEGYASN